MSHITLDEEAQARAALYALGALDPDEARQFEEHAAGCEECSKELRCFESVAAALAVAPGEAEPPASVRTRLMTLVSEEDGRKTGDEAPADAAGQRAPHAHATADGPNLLGAAAGYLVVRKDEGKWRPTGDAGISYKLLYADRERGTYTTLVRMEPGARIPAHRHVGVEQCLVLEGDLRAGVL
ncbi:MAG TPA: cupin domain-containing protein, partial [Pyrinomonadaceae bacterium]|nr:cupin domain-containing protein [Pyrinomonadaceae bacterium]